MRAGRVASPMPVLAERLNDVAATAAALREAETAVGERRAEVRQALVAAHEAGATYEQLAPLGGYLAPTLEVAA